MAEGYFIKRVYRAPDLCFRIFQICGFRFSEQLQRNFITLAFCPGQPFFSRFELHFVERRRPDINIFRMAVRVFINNIDIVRYYCPFLDADRSRITRTRIRRKRSGTCHFCEVGALFSFLHGFMFKDEKSIVTKGNNFSSASS